MIYFFSNTDPRSVFPEKSSSFGDPLLIPRKRKKRRNFAKHATAAAGGATTRFEMRDPQWDIVGTSTGTLDIFLRL